MEDIYNKSHLRLFILPWRCIAWPYKETIHGVNSQARSLTRPAQPVTPPKTWSAAWAQSSTTSRNNAARRRRIRTFRLQYLRFRQLLQRSNSNRTAIRMQMSIGASWRPRNPVSCSRGHRSRMIQIGTRLSKQQHQPLDKTHKLHKQTQTPGSVPPVKVARLIRSQSPTRSRSKRNRTS